MTNEQDEVSIAIEQIEQRIQPLELIKTAFSSISVLLLICTGVLLNWILAIVFILSCFSTSSWGVLLVGILALVLVFPAAYAYIAYTYGQQVVVFEVYQEVIRPVAANLIASILNKIIKDSPQDSPLDSKQIQKEFDEQSNSLWEAIPDFISNSLGILNTIKDVIILITEQYQQGGEKEVVKNRIISQVFELFDARMEELASPSLSNFFILLIINVGVLFFLF